VQIRIPDSSDISRTGANLYQMSPNVFFGLPSIAMLGNGHLQYMQEVKGIFLNIHSPADRAI
jgi:hypothetical protein